MAKLKRGGIIEEKYTKYLSPAFFIKKSNGDLSLVIGYRPLNRVAKPKHFPTPKINEQLFVLRGSKHFSQTGLKAGYYQVGMEAGIKLKTGFILMNRIYVFKRMPFGSSNAPFTFQEAMIQILGQLE